MISSLTAEEGRSKEASNRSSPRKSASNNRKPSYVGLSKAVNGYSSFNRYNSERKTTPPSAIPVKEPLRPVAMRGEGVVEDAVDNALTFRKKFEVETTAKFYNRQNRETSPGSDCGSCSSAGSSGVSSGSQSGGNLIQKQIERLYGGKVYSIHSPPDPRTSFEEEDQRRRSWTKKRDDTPIKHNNGPLHFKPLKIPAVFRLLRPEFREQLKTHSCTVDIPTETIKKERIIPISRTDETVLDKKPRERIIPIRRIDSEHNNDNNNNHNNNNNNTRSTNVKLLPLKTPSPKSPIKPALPVKPASPASDKTLLSSPTEEIKAPALVSEVEKSRPKVEIVDERIESVIQILEESKSDSAEDEKPSNGDEFNEYDATEEDGDLGALSRGGIRERELLCTILEEDNESTASGGSLPRANGLLQRKTVMTNGRSISKDDNDDEGGEGNIQVVPEKDGHYFIKLIENEVFKFEEQICDFEEDFCNNEAIMSEDVRESILAAIGKARLLMSQKLAQFRGLCDKNITLNVEQDPFVPTSDDLAGFWDMVYIQVEHIHSLFAELIVIRNNGWKRPEIEKKETQITKRKVKKKIAPTKKTTTISEVSKARDAARRKLLEEKKRQLSKQKQNSGDDVVQMFVT